MNMSLRRCGRAFINLQYANIAQLVEQLFRMQWVIGSIPIIGSSWGDGLISVPHPRGDTLIKEYMDISLVSWVRLLSI